MSGFDLQASSDSDVAWTSHSEPSRPLSERLSACAIRGLFVAFCLASWALAFALVGWIA